MFVLRVKDRGRDLAVHQSESEDEARELARVYEQLGYPMEKISIEQIETGQPRAA